MGKKIDFQDSVNLTRFSPKGSISIFPVNSKLVYFQCFDEIFSLKFNFIFFSSNQKFVDFQCFDEIFRSVSIFTDEPKVCLFSTF